MFKRSLLTVVLAGLIAGSVKPEEQKTNAMAEKVQKLRDTVSASYGMNKAALAISGLGASVVFVRAMMEIFGSTRSPWYSSSPDAEMLAKDFVVPIRLELMAAGVCGAIVAYNAMVLYFGKRKVQALDEIKAELETQQA